jgi:predicted protein tyrosine phosphatase
MYTRSPETLYVCPLDAVDAVVARTRPGHMISLVNDEVMRELTTPGCVPRERHLRLTMNDITEPRDGHVAPSPEHVAAMVDFIMSWDRSAPVLVNCLAGVSRSTAAAFTIVCALNPQTDERRIARLLRESSPTAQPNPRLVNFADEVLGREGRMIEAAGAIAATAVLEPARPFAMPVRVTAKA